jgi:hypothetical protein
MPERMRTLAKHKHPSLESVGSHAVHAISKHNDETHAAVLEAIQELLAIGADRRSAPRSHPAGVARVGLTPRPEDELTH